MNSSTINSALLEGILSQNISQVKQALSGGGDPNDIVVYDSQRVFDGRLGIQGQYSLLALAVDQGEAAIINQLIKAGADLNLVGGSCVPALFFALNDDRSHFIEPLLKAGALCQSDSFESSALDTAIINDSIQSLAILLHQPITEHDHSFNPIHIAADYQSHLALEFLITHFLPLYPHWLNQTLDKMGKMGHTPLSLASLRNNVIGTKMLLDAGADPLKKTMHGYTAEELANIHNSLDVMMFYPHYRADLEAHLLSESIRPGLCDDRDAAQSSLKLVKTPSKRGL